METPWPWHRLFGLSLIDFFHGLPVAVEVEKDLSLKQQLLDVVVVRKEAAPLTVRLPDGLEDLAAHNPITFKSHQQPLDGWALDELVGHYVNYRKQTSPSLRELLPETDFRLFAVSARFPRGLSSQIELTPVQAGVYDVRRFSGPIRLIVVNELAAAEHNSVLHLFSSQTDLIKYGIEHYRQRSAETSMLLHRLISRFEREDPIMVDLLAESRKDEKEVEAAFQKRLLELEECVGKSIPIEREGLSPEVRYMDLMIEWRKVQAEREFRKRLSAMVQRVGLTPEERLEGMSAEDRLKGLSLEEILNAIPPESRASLKEKLKDAEAAPLPDGDKEE